MMRFKAIFTEIDLSDIMILVGMGLSGWGLYQYEPWVAETAIGGLLVVFGYIRGR